MFFISQFHLWIEKSNQFINFHIIFLSLQPYQPGYTAPPPPPHSEDTAIDIRQVCILSLLLGITVHGPVSYMLIYWKLYSFCFVDVSHSEGWTISGAPLDLHDPRLLAMAAAERHLLEAEYDDYANTSASGAAFCRSAALIVSHENHFLTWIYTMSKYLVYRYQMSWWACHFRWELCC